MAKNLWRTSTGNRNFYGTSTSGSEANMRQEMINTLDGSYPETAKGQPALLRIMRRDSDSQLIPCECVNTLTREPDKDRFCPQCFGEGWYWDEEEIVLYRTLGLADSSNSTRDKLLPPGLLNIPLVISYIRYSHNITPEDRVILLELEDDGTKSVPTRRKAIQRIAALWDYRADNGKLEYWKVFSYEEKVKYLNAPTYEDLV